MASHRQAQYLLAGLLALGVAAGCGSAASPAMTPKTHAKVLTTGNLGSSPLDAWVVKGNEEPGYKGTGITAANTVPQFVAPYPVSQQASEAPPRDHQGNRGRPMS